MGSESGAMLQQSDEDAPGVVRRDACSTMDTASGAKTKTEKKVSMLFSFHHVTQFFTILMLL